MQSEPSNWFYKGIKKNPKICSLIKKKKKMLKGKKIPSDIWIYIGFIYDLIGYEKSLKPSLPGMDRDSFLMFEAV